MQETLGIFLLLVAIAPLVAAGYWLLVKAQKTGSELQPREVFMA
jgi:hypothetical protein